MSKPPPKRASTILTALTVKGPKRFTLSRTPTIDVGIALPAGSRIQGETGWGDFRGEGRLDACTLKTAFGSIWLQETGPLVLDTSLGDITIGRAAGHAQITTGSGQVHIGEIDGSAVLRNANGATWVGTITGDLRLNVANGDSTIDHAQASVEAKSANGSIRIGEVARGTTSLETSLGTLEIGIRRGTAAKLDIRSQAGHIHNTLDTTAGPEPTDEIAEIRARTSVGDIVIRRAQD